MKSRLKAIGRQAWSLFKSGMPSMLMWFCAGAVLMMLTLKEEALAWDGNKLTWTLVCVLVASAYGLFIAYAQGGESYEMLVTGNVNRRALDESGVAYKMSKYRYEKEYRVWKGFATGAYTALFTLISVLVVACNQTEILGGTVSKGTSIAFFICVLIGGWVILPIYYLNMSGLTVSFFVGLPFALLPCLFAGGMYIAGAYARRAKRLKAEEVERRVREEKENREKKINYGALPGTKPRKRK